MPVNSINGERRARRVEPSKRRPRPVSAIGDLEQRPPKQQPTYEVNQARGPKQRRREVNVVALTPAPMLGGATSGAPPPRLLRAAEVRAITGMTKALLYRAMKAGEFPAAIPPTDQGRSVGWLNTEVYAWLNERVRKARAPGAPSRQHLAGPGRGHKKLVSKPAQAFEDDNVNAQAKLPPTRPKKRRSRQPMTTA